MIMMLFNLLIRDINKAITFCLKKMKHEQVYYNVVAVVVASTSELQP